MAKVAIASCYDKRNFGSMLQAYATERAIEKMGHEVVTIDKSGLSADIARGRRLYYIEHLLDIELYRAKVGFAGHRVREKLDKEFGSKMARRYRAFDRFRNGSFHLSPHFGSLRELGDWTRGFDSVVVGSDQLWLPVNIAGNYFTLSFVQKPCKKVSYATSFGVSELSERYLHSASEFLSGFSSVSVREETGADLVERACGKRPSVVCDPSMLLSREEWAAVSDCSLVPDEPYALCYFLGKTRWHRECARRFAAIRGLRLVALAHPDEYVRHDDSYADVYPWDCGPAEWVGLMSRASVVFTDSFHGTAFSNIFERPFVSFRRHENMGAQSTNTRLDTLLERLGMKGRICERKGNFEGISSEEVDFSSSRNRLATFVGSSRSFLESALGSGKNHDSNY